MSSIISEKSKSDDEAVLKWVCADIKDGVDDKDVPPGDWERLNPGTSVLGGVLGGSITSTGALLFKELEF